ncbi:MAG: carboxypeptidase-like regulatory domain-containing protein, partial [Terriglobales bacterium]
MKRKFRMPLPPRWFTCFSLPLILILGSTLVAWAQYTTARLSGLITDPSEAVVAGATLTVQDQGTGYSQTTKSESDGRYI